MKWLLPVALLLFAHPAFAQFDLIDPSTIDIQPVVNFQGWATYTNDFKIYNESNESYEAVDDRLNFLLRRTQIGFKGKAFNRLQFTLVGAYDFIGRDVLTGPVGTAFNTGSPRIRLWVAKAQVQLLKSSDLLHLSFGYMRPNVSRESISSALQASSFEKAWSQNYIRRHMVGTGPGRATGLNLGGMHRSSAESKFAMSYNLGIFNPTFSANSNNSAGTKQSPVLAYQLAFHFGDPESKAYSTSHKHNHFGKRKGLTLTFSGSENGETFNWETNRIYGADLLFNWGPVNLSGEYMTLYRASDAIGETTAQVGFAKASVNIPAGKLVLEPTINYMFFLGETDIDAQRSALEMGALAGEDSYIDFTINLYFSPKVFLSLAYVARTGNSGELGDGFTGNNYFSQGSVGAIQRGNYFGTGFVFRL
ncbi:MAG: OprO/OprP family phosphate-selective porin [Saprospiraceae bacterium]|nr:OprO/OprP family phosphate-selective porin [Saprospiraceae bacterium]